MNTVMVFIIIPIVYNTQYSSNAYEYIVDTYKQDTY